MFENSSFNSFCFRYSREFVCTLYRLIEIIKKMTGGLDKMKNTENNEEQKTNHIFVYMKKLLYMVSDVMLIFFKGYCILTGLILLSEINALSGVINETLLMESIESLKTGTYLSDCIISISSLIWIVLIGIFLMHSETRKVYVAMVLWILQIGLRIFQRNTLLVSLFRPESIIMYVVIFSIIKIFTCEQVENYIKHFKNQYTVITGNNMLYTYDVVIKGSYAWVEAEKTLYRIISDDESELQADAIITSDDVKINACRVSSFASEEAAFGAMEYIKGVARKGLEK